MTSPAYSGNVARAYGYDALGRLTNMVDAVGTTTYTYTLGTGGLEAMTEDGPWAADTVTVTNRHGLRSHLVVGQPNGTFATTYGWDAARRMTNVTAGGQGFGYTYLGAGGQIARVSLPGGSTITNTFDSLGRHTSTALRTSGGTNLNLHGYSYDPADRRTWISRTNSANTSWNGYASFGYDAAGQLVRAQTTNAAGSEVTSERFGYVYDASQNLRWRTNNTSVTGFTNNALNQLTSLNATTRTHDRRGNLLSNVQTGETLLYSWDDESQLTSVRVDSASSPAFQPWRIDFVYDGLRRLRRTLQFTWNGSAWTSQGEVRYLYDGMLIVQERNAGNAPQVHYSRGVDLSGTIHGAGGIGGLLMRSHGLSGTNWSSHNAYHSDANGNVTALVNSSGVLQASYRYNPYGGLISSIGALASANTMRFSSKPAIFSASGSWGFYYYGYRFYDPVNQRWLNRDPLGEAGGRNLYGFVGNGPIHRADPLGLYWFEWGDSWPNYLGPEPNAKPRVGPPPPPPADPEEDLNLMRCSYGGMQIGEDAAHEAAELVRDVGREVVMGVADVATGGLMGRLRPVTLAKNCPRAANSARHWNPLNGPGPLGNKVAATFRGASYTESVTSEATTLYRVHGGKASELGPYWTRTAPAGPLQSQIDSALLPEWGNTAQNVTRIQVPSGTRIFEGFAAPQGGLVGGGNQVFIPHVDPSWIIK